MKKYEIKIYFKDYITFSLLENIFRLIKTKYLNEIMAESYISAINWFVSLLIWKLEIIINLYYVESRTFKIRKLLKLFGFVLKWIHTFKI